MRTTSSLILGIFGVFLITMAFQNCAPAFTGKQSTSSASLSDYEGMTLQDVCEGMNSADCVSIQKAYQTVLYREPGRDEITEWQNKINNKSVELKNLPTLLASTVEAQHIPAASSAKSILWGPWVVGVSGRNKPIQSLKVFNSMAGKPASLAGFNTWWSVSSAKGDFNTTVRDWMNGVRSQGATPVLLWNPIDMNSRTLCTDPNFANHLKNFTPKAISSGRHDAYIRKWAQQARAWGHPFYLRVFHELNGRTNTNNPCDIPTKVWDAELTLNGEMLNNNQDSIEAWRHVVSLFRAEGATNVNFMWSVLSWPSANFGGNNPIALKNIYPGDDYVDSIGIECYAFARSNLESCEHLMRAAYSEAAALSPTRPIMNIEMGAFAGAEKSQWIKKALNRNGGRDIFSQFPRLTGFLYWDDSRYHESLEGLWIKSDANSAAEFKAAMSSPDYLVGSSGGADDTRKGCSSIDGSSLMHASLAFFYNTPSSQSCEKHRIARFCDDGVLSSSHPQDKDFVYTECGNKPLDANQARLAVIDAYKNILSRTDAENAKDAAGINHFVNKLMSGVSLEQIQNELRASDEYFVRQEYIKILGRNVDAPGLTYYLSQLSSGAKTRAQVTADLKFADTRETGTAITDAQARQVVTDLFINVMGRTLAEVQDDPTGLAYYVQLYRAGTKTTAQIRADFLASDEYYVRQQYLSILRRRADLPGLRFYVGQLASRVKNRAQISQDLQHICNNRIGGECR